MTVMPSPAPSRFESTAGYYARFRPGYPAAAIDLLVDRFQLSPTTRVLDLGCGTGQLAIPFAARGIPVHAVDPDLDMLIEGIRAESHAGVSGINWMRGDDTGLPTLPLPPLHLCTMGASFHWMDRSRILMELDRRGVIGISVLSNGSVWSGEGDDWEAVVKQVIVEFLGSERRAGAGTYVHPEDRHETVLEQSPFPSVERHTFKTAYNWTIDDIIGLQLSTSYASSAQLSERLTDFRRVMHERLAPLATDGALAVEVISEILIATR